MNFIKSEALGNDFVMVNGSGEDQHELSRRLADRRLGIGCDQILYFDISSQNSAQVWFYNADGSEAESCGNGTRCLVEWLTRAGCVDQSGNVYLHTRGGELVGRKLNDGRIQVDYPLPTLDTSPVVPELKGPSHAVWVGNPHLVCWTHQLDELHKRGAELEYHPYFKDRVNVGFAHLDEEGAVQLRVWERGTGLTPACGSGALAAAYSAHYLRIVNHPIYVEQEGGVLEVRIHTNYVQLIGGAQIIFEGKWLRT